MAYQRQKNTRRLDTLKVTIEEVNLDARTPIAQGRDRTQHGLIDIDLSHGVGSKFPTPAVGEVWWIKRTPGSVWILDHKVDPNRDGGEGDGNRAGVPDHVVLGFNVRETKTRLIYSAYTTFDPVTEDALGNPDTPEHYLIDWVACSKQGNILALEKVRRHNWSANDAEIDEPDDPGNDYYVELPGRVDNPKKWYYKARVRAVSGSMFKGEWSDWTDPVNPFRVALPRPPAPDNVHLRFRLREHKNHQEFRGIVSFDDVNFWDIPGYDFEDDVAKYVVQLQPLHINDDLQEIELASWNNDGDSFRLTYNLEETVDIVKGVNGGADGIQAALEGLPGIEPGDVFVKRKYRGQNIFQVRFLGRFADPNEYQVLENTGSPDGEFTMEFNGQVTDTVSRAALAEDIQYELSTLTNIGSNNVKCTGGPLGEAAIRINFVNDLAASDIPEIVLGGTTTDMTILTEADGTADVSELSVTNAINCTGTVTRTKVAADSPLITAEEVQWPLPKPWDAKAFDNPELADEWYPRTHRFSEVFEGVNEVQAVENFGSTAGTFTITLDGETTAAISRSATANQVETALEALSNVGSGNVNVTLGPLGTNRVEIEFKGDLAKVDVKQMKLGGTDTKMSVVTKTQGDDDEAWPVRRRTVQDKDSDDVYVTLGGLSVDIIETDTIFDVEETSDTPLTLPFIIQIGDERMLVYTRTLVGGVAYTYEVYRQFQDTPFRAHSTGDAILWLKNPYRYKVQYDHIPRPKTIWWRARARSMDRFNRRGPWSEWTQTKLPWTAADMKPPPPENVRGEVLLDAHRTRNVYKLAVKFKDPAPEGWDVPGGDPEDDLERYVVQGQALIRDDENGYIDGYDDHFYRIPDRKIGVLATDLTESTETVTITLDADLPPTILAQMDDLTKPVHLRLNDPNIVDAMDEIITTTSLTGSAGNDRTYTIERAQKESPARGWDLGLTEVYMLSERIRRAHTKDKDEPGRVEHYTVELGRVKIASNKTGQLETTEPAINPDPHYWRVRAASIDHYNRRSDWAPVKDTPDSSWTNPFLPGEDPDLVVPAPDYVALNFDRVHRNKNNRWRAIVEFAEVEYLAPDGDRKEDITRYAVQLAQSDQDALNTGIDIDDTTMVVDEKRLPPQETPFSVLIDSDANPGETDEIVKVTSRVLASGNQYTYTIERAARGSEASPHSSGVFLYHLPFDHRKVSAKNDDDPNNYNRAVFMRTRKWNYYKARVRAFDRYNRVSLWTPWTIKGTPSDSIPPPLPTNVELTVLKRRAHVTWDAPVELVDPDGDGKGTILSDDIAYFQVQLSREQPDFDPILKFDRHHPSTSKNFRVRKPRSDTFYARVRAVDGAGNKSGWVESNAAMEGIPTPDVPTIVYDVAEATKKIRALVSTTDINESETQEGWTIDRGGATGGDFALTVKSIEGSTQEGPLIPWDASVAGVQATLDGLDIFADGDVVVSAGTGDDLVFTWTATGPVGTNGVVVLDDNTTGGTGVMATRTTPGFGGFDDIDGYEFQLQPAEFKRLNGSITAGAGSLVVNNSTNVPSTPFTAYIQKEEILVSVVAGTTWTIARGQNATTAKSHRDRAKVQYFRGATKKRRHKVGEAGEPGDPVLTIYTRIQRRLWYRARVRAYDSDGKWGAFSNWS